MDDIQQSLAVVFGREDVITQTEKIGLAESYEPVAANCFKAVITAEPAPEMAMTM